MRTFEQELLFRKINPQDLTEEQYDSLSAKYNEFLKLEEAYKNMPETDIIMTDYETFVRPNDSDKRLTCLQEQLELLIDLDSEFEAVKKGIKAVKM